MSPPIGSARAGLVSQVGDEIPDSVVSRPYDNTTGNIAFKYGIRIETNVEWPKIGGRISSQTSGATTAYIHRVSDGTLMGSTDISNLSGGDAFTIDLDTNLVDGETYNFVLDAGGSSYTAGSYDSPSFPYTSSDGDLSIVTGAANENGDSSQANTIKEVGDVGF